MLQELKVAEAMENALGDDLERELDAAFERAGGEDADLSKVFLDTEGGGVPEVEVSSSAVSPQVE